jgi:MFS family permease
MSVQDSSLLRAEKQNPLSRVILGSATGTMIEWYDFYIFGSLTSVLAVKFYPPGNDTFALIAYLATFAVGFLVRPFGALFFGRIGDIFGRRIAFIITLTVMGASTASIGLLPTFKTAGWFSPVALIIIRMLQGLALGGEYGGAAVYVAEHVPDDKRGYYTSFIQITATLGLFVSLLAIIVTQQSMSPATFQQWGWRLPFLLSLILVSISLYIRIRMKESPIFSHLKSAGMNSAKPITEAFTQWENLKRVLVSLFGATAGQGVVWYAGQFYALFYLQTILKVNPRTANIIVAVALLFAMPFFTVFGALSDRIGRKKLMMAGLLIPVLCYIPIYKAMQHAAGNNVVAVSSIKDKVTGAIKLTPLTPEPESGKLVPAKEAVNANQPLLMLLIWIQVIFGCMIYGPIAAYLVEAFPAKVRYTSVSLPYHIGNGVFGGLLPLIGLSICASTGNIYAGLYYPMAVAGLTFLIGSALLKETHGTLIWDEVKGAK